MAKLEKTARKEEVYIIKITRSDKIAIRDIEDYIDEAVSLYRENCSPSALIRTAVKIGHDFDDTKAVKKATVNRVKKLLNWLEVWKR